MYTKEHDKIATQNLQVKLRLKLLELYFKANAGHIGCSLSCIDMMIACLIYSKNQGDEFILSKGHAAAALYICLHELGEISKLTLDTFYNNGTILPAHPAPRKLDSIPFATGSLGHGMPIGVGIALANKINEKDNFTYVLMSDGETNEGTTWESAHFAVKHGLDHLILLIDKNGLQGFGSTKDVLGDTACIDIWSSLGFDAIEVDGHDVYALINMIDHQKKHLNGMPKVLICNTIKGKGVSFMEDRLEWHYLPMSAEQFDLAKNEILGD